MKVVTSKKAKDILGRPNAIKLIKALNQASEEIVGDIGINFSSSGEFKPFKIEKQLRMTICLKFQMD